MVVVPFRYLLAKFTLYQLHQTVGIVVFVLIAVSLVLHSRSLRWNRDEAFASWQRRAAFGVHALLYVLLAAAPILGYLTAATAPAQIPTFFLGFIRVPNIVGEHLAWFPVLKQLHRALANLIVLLGSGDALAAVLGHVPAMIVLARKWGKQHERARLAEAEPIASPEASTSLQQGVRSEVSGVDPQSSLH
jgi:cytochrome b561